VDAKQQQLPVWPWLMATLVLNLAGFLLYLVYAAAKSGDWKRAAISLAYVAEVVMVGMLVLVPLIYTQALPRTLLVTEVHILPPPGPSPAQPMTQRPKPVHHATSEVLQAPPRIPPNIQVIVEAPEPPQTGSTTGPGVIGAPPGGPPTGPMIAVIGSVPWGDAPPPPPQTHSAPKVHMVHVGGNVIAAMGLYQPRPDYPYLARIARVQGTVAMQAIIGRDGTVQDLKVVCGPPLLIKAAVDAVKTWRYQPTLLNGEPVDVLTEINVNFTLAQ
jgi:protein TonB